MHTKSILAITLIAVFVIGVISFDDAFAQIADVGPEVFATINVWDALKIQGKGTGDCTSGEDSGNVKGKFTSILRIDEVNDEDLNGLAKAKIRLNSTCDGLPKELVDDEPLVFSYDSGINNLTVSGDMKAKDGSVFSLDGIGEFEIISKDHGDPNTLVINLSLGLVGQNGDIFTVDIVDNPSQTSTWG